MPRQGKTIQANNKTKQNTRQDETSQEQHKIIPNQYKNKAKDNTSQNKTITQQDKVM